MKIIVRQDRCELFLPAFCRESAFCRSWTPDFVSKAYSSPPKHGAAIVNKVLTTPALKEMWLKELSLMSSRISDMRAPWCKSVNSLP